MKFPCGYWKLRRYKFCSFATGMQIPFNLNTHALIDAVNEVLDDEDMKFQERTALQFGMIDVGVSRTNRVGERHPSERDNRYVTPSLGKLDRKAMKGRCLTHSTVGPKEVPYEEPPKGPVNYLDSSFLGFIFNCRSKGKIHPLQKRSIIKDGTQY